MLLNPYQKFELSKFLLSIPSSDVATRNLVKALLEEGEGEDYSREDQERHLYNAMTEVLSQLYKKESTDAITLLAYCCYHDIVLGLLTKNEIQKVNNIPWSDYPLMIIDSLSEIGEGLSPFAEYYLGCLLLKYSNSKDVSLGISWIKKAAEHKHFACIFAQANLGYRYLHGLEIKKDLKSARELLDKSSLNQNPLAQMGIGDIYEQGLGVEVNPRLAYKNYMRAASQNYVLAKFGIAKCLYFGIGVEKNIVQAFNTLSALISDLKKNSSNSRTSHRAWGMIDLPQSLRTIPNTWFLDLLKSNNTDALSYMVYECCKARMGSINVNMEKLIGFDINFYGNKCETFIHYLNLLRERFPSQIPPLLRYFLDKLTKEFGCNLIVNNCIQVESIESLEYLLSVEFITLKYRTANNQTLLLESVNCGKKRMVQHLLTKPEVNVLDINSQGDSALHIAAMTKDPVMIQLLLQQGAYYQMLNNNQQLPSDNYSDPICRNLLLFVNRIFDMCRKEEANFTTFDWYADLCRMYLNRESLQLKNGIEGARDDQGDTILHIILGKILSREESSLHVFNILSEVINLDISNNKGQTAWDLAHSNKVNSGMYFEFVLLGIKKLKYLMLQQKLIHVDRDSKESKELSELKIKFTETFKQILEAMNQWRMKIKSTEIKRLQIYFQECEHLANTIGDHSHPFFMPLMCYKLLACIPEYLGNPSSDGPNSNSELVQTHMKTFIKAQEKCEELLTLRYVYPKSVQSSNNSQLGLEANDNAYNIEFFGIDSQNSAVEQENDGKYAKDSVPMEDENALGVHNSLGHDKAKDKGIDFREICHKVKDEDPELKKLRLFYIIFHKIRAGKRNDPEIFGYIKGDILGEPCLGKLNSLDVHFNKMIFPEGDMFDIMNQPLPGLEKEIVLNFLWNFINHSNHYSNKALFALPSSESMNDKAISNKPGSMEFELQQTKLELEQVKQENQRLKEAARKQSVYCLPQFDSKKRAENLAFSNLSSMDTSDNSHSASSNANTVVNANAPSGQSIHLEGNTEAVESSLSAEDARAGSSKKRKQNPMKASNLISIDVLERSSDDSSRYAKRQRS